MKEVAKLKRTLNLAPVLQIFQKILENYCSWLYLLIGQVWWLNELWFRRYIQKWALSHVIILIMVTHLVNHGMVENTKNLISWEWNIAFLRNKKILNLFFRWHILGSYRSVAEVTCNCFSFLNVWLHSEYGSVKVCRK